MVSYNAGSRNLSLDFFDISVLVPAAKHSGPWMINNDWKPKRGKDLILGLWVTFHELEVCWGPTQYFLQSGPFLKAYQVFHT